MTSGQIIHEVLHSLERSMTTEELRTATMLTGQQVLDGVRELLDAKTVRLDRQRVSPIDRDGRDLFEPMVRGDADRDCFIAWPSLIQQHTRAIIEAEPPHRLKLRAPTMYPPDEFETREVRENRSRRTGWFSA